MSYSFSVSGRPMKILMYNPVESESKLLAPANATMSVSKWGKAEMSDPLAAAIMLPLPTPEAIAKESGCRGVSVAKGIQMETKHCPKCDTHKSLDDFFNNKSRGDGKDSYCKSCKKERAKVYKKREGRVHIVLVRSVKSSNRKRSLVHTSGIARNVSESMSKRDITKRSEVNGLKIRIRNVNRR